MSDPDRIVKCIVDIQEGERSSNEENKYAKQIRERFDELTFLEIKKKFDELDEKIHDDPRFSSRVKDSINHPNFSSILSLGNDVIPVIFYYLQQPGAENGLMDDFTRPSWRHISMLSCLCGPISIPEDSRGKWPKVRELWLQKGRELGYI